MEAKYAIPVDEPVDEGAEEDMSSSHTLDFSDFVEVKTEIKDEPDIDIGETRVKVELLDNSDNGGYNNCMLYLYR